MTPPLVLLDACVLVPQRLSSLLLTMAEQGLFEARWSEQILEETERAMVTSLHLDPGLVGRRIDAMRHAFPEASVAGYEQVQDELTCHPKDRHVLAAAITGGAETLVTFNRRDFPPAACEPYDIAVLDPDLFLLELLASDQPGCESAVDAEAARMQRPPLTPRDVLAGIALVAPIFANTLHYHRGERAGATPAYEAAPTTESPLQEFAENPDLSNPLHVAMCWWSCLQDRGDPAALEVLHALTWSPAAFGDYAWVEKDLAGRSLASKVYLAVDDPDGNVAYLRFVPGVAQSARVFAPFQESGAVFVTLRRRGNGRWCVWGVGRMANTRDVLREHHD